MHASDALIRTRRFDDDRVMASRFEPAGALPCGCRTGRSGAAELNHGVDVVDGSWRRQSLCARGRGIRVSLTLLPRSRTGKRLENGRCRFEGSFALPVLGEALAYGGVLDVVDDTVGD